MNATPKEEILFHEHGREEISLINERKDYPLWGNLTSISKSYIAIRSAIFTLLTPTVKAGLKFILKSKESENLCF